LKHLLRKNGVNKSPELDDDVRCEALLNSKAKQQRRSSVTDCSSPPAKKQRFLGVNKNNEVIIVEDAGTASPAASPSKRPSSLPVHSECPSSFYSMPSAGDGISHLLVANGNVIDTDTQPKAATAEHHPQLCNNQADVTNEVICIDDDDDDSVLLVTDSPKMERCAGTSSVKSDDRSSSVLSVQKASANAVTSEPLSAVSAKNVCAGNGNSDSATAYVNLDDTSDSEHLPSSSNKVTDSCLSTPSSDGQQHTSPTTNVHHSPSSRKIARLENLLKVGVFMLRFLLKLVICRLFLKVNTFFYFCKEFSKFAPINHFSLVTPLNFGHLFVCHFTFVL